MSYGKYLSLSDIKMSNSYKGLSYIYIDVFIFTKRHNILKRDVTFVHKDSAFLYRDSCKFLHIYVIFYIQISHSYL